MYRLIIVEDENIIRKGLREHIPWNELGYEVVGEADNGRAALELIPHVKPDVVLTDIKMPLMNGIDLMRELKSLYTDIRIVILSSHDEFEYARKGIEYGAYAYILRPADEDTFMDVFMRLKTDLDNKRKQLPYGNEERLFTDILDGRLTGRELESSMPDLFKRGANLQAFFGAVVFQAAVSKKTPEGEDITPVNLALHEDVCRWITAAVRLFSNMTCEEIVYDRKSFTFTAVLSVNAVLSKNDSLYAVKRIIPVISDFPGGETEETLYISAGIGRFYGISSLGISQNEARTALKNRFYRGCGSINHVDDCIFKDDRMLKDKVSGKAAAAGMEEMDKEQELCDRLVGIMYQHDKGSIRGVLNSYFTVEKLRYSDPEELYGRIIRLFTMISVRLGDRGIDLKDILNSDVYNRIKQIITFQSVTQLNDRLNNLLAGIVHNEVFARDRSAQEENEYIDRVLKYMEENYDRRISLEEVAGMCFFCPQYFSIWFKSKTGYTFKDYVTGIRMKKARELLEDTSLKVYEVSSLVGYDDFRYFTRIFKKIVGYSPGEYKKEVAG